MLINVAAPTGNALMYKLWVGWRIILSQISGNIMYLAMVTPVNKTKRRILRKKMIKVTTLIAGLPFPYGNAWTRADVAPVPMITVCQAQVKLLLHINQGAAMDMLLHAPYTFPP